MEGSSCTDGKTFTGNPQKPGEIIEIESKITKIRLNPDDDSYDMTGENILLIINHKTYMKPRTGLFYNKKQLSSRNGTENDVSRLHHLFKDILGYKVYQYTDLTYDRILDLLKAFTERDHSKTSSVSVAILTHGDSGGMVSAYDRFYPLNDVFRLFENGNATLLGKPKSFFIQACRGDDLESGRQLETDGMPRIFTIPSQADFLIIYSTIEGFVAYRSSEGSWMIQALCDVIETNDNYKRLDFLNIVTKMNNKIAYEQVSYCPDDPELDNKKQMCECRFTLTKQLYLGHGSKI